jgi:hypothetical protein
MSEEVKSEGGKIIVPIEVSVQNKEDLKAMIAEFEVLKNDVREVRNVLIESHARVPGVEQLTFPAEGKESATPLEPETEEDVIKRLVDREIRNTVNELTGEHTPTGAIEGGDEEGGGFGLGVSGAMGLGRSVVSGPGAILRSLGKLIPYISEALMAFGFAELIISKVYGPGGWLDVRWKRDIQSEFMGLWTRQQQQDRKVGVSQVVIASSARFRYSNGVDVTNSFRDIKLYGIERRVGYLEKRSGQRATPN